MRKKTKVEKGFLALLITPEIVLLSVFIVSTILYLFFS